MPKIIDECLLEKQESISKQEKTGKIYKEISKIAFPAIIC